MAAMYIVSVALLVGGIIWLVAKYFTGKTARSIRHVETGQQIPSVPTAREIWNFVLILIKWKKDFDSITDILEKKKKYGSTFLAWRGSSMVFISKTEDIQKWANPELFDKDEAYFTKNHSLFRVFGESVVASVGDKWCQQREALTPAFRGDRLKDMVPTFSSCAKRLVAYWNRKLNKEPQGILRIYPAVSKMVLDSLGLAGFSHDFKALETDTAESLRLYKIILKSMFIPLPDWVLNIPLPRFKKLKNAFEEMDKILYGVIDRHKGDRGDVLAHLLSLKDTNLGLTKKQLRDNLFMFFIAGHDTSASALTCALYFLSLYPEIQQKAYHEIRNVVGNRDSLVHDDLAKLPYIRNIVRETLRLRPPVDSTTQRKCLKEGVVLGGYAIPVGMEVMPSLPLANYDETVFPDPMTFNPDRWEGKSDSTDLLSFSYGQRNCVGKKWSILVVITSLALLLQKFEFELRPNYEWKYRPLSVAIRPLDGLPLIVKKRK